MWVLAKEVNEAHRTRQAGFSRLRTVAPRRLREAYIGDFPAKFAVKIACPPTGRPCSRSLYLPFV